MMAHGPLTRARHETRDQISDVQEEEDLRNVSWEDQDQENCDIITYSILGSARPIVPSETDHVT